jgi:hypothetical protein
MKYLLSLVLIFALMLTSLNAYPQRNEPNGGRYSNGANYSRKELILALRNQGRNAIDFVPKEPPRVFDSRDFLRYGGPQKAHLPPLRYN